MRNIDPSLLSRLNSQQQTHYNNANPRMSVQVSRAKTTVSDSTYWTVETIRERPGLGDLSLAARREKAYGPPNRIYNIYVDNGVVKTAIREYPDYLKEKWKDQFNIGPGTAVAIAFDGEWEWWRKKWQLKTYEEPWLFWVNGGKLWTQLWDDVDTLFELASGVSKVKAIRGWKNANFADRDQGVIAGYIKSDGKLYYRNYCQQTDGKIIWETERQITEFTEIAVNLNMFITNDYRMGLVVEDNIGKVHWIITERNWAGMAIQNHVINGAAGEVKVDFIPIQYHEVYSPTETIEAAVGEPSFELGYTLTDNTFFDIYNEPTTSIDENNEEYQDWGKVLIISIGNNVADLTLSDIEIVDSSNRTYSANEIEKIGRQTYRLEFIGLNNFNNVGDVGVLKYKGLYGKNALDNLYLPFDKVFYPINLVPTEIPLPEVEVIWNE